MGTQQCPCGYHGDRGRECRCSSGEVVGYRSRISGPLLDRIDLHVDVPALEYRELTGEGGGEGTPAVRGRVERAREVQRGRLAGSRAFCNAQMNTRETREHCRLDREGSILLEGAMRGLGLSARGYSKVLKVSRTIADLAGEQAIGSAHVAEALQYRERARAG